MEVAIPALERTYRPWSCPRQRPPMACPVVLDGSCLPVTCPKGDPPVPTPEPFHPDFQSTTHVTLKATRDVLPAPNKGPVLVSIVDGSKGKVIQKKVDRSETVEKVKQKFLQEMPELQWMSLVCNGKPLQESQVLRDLHLGEKVTFIPFQRCHGG